MSSVAEASLSTPDRQRFPLLRALLADPFTCVALILVTGFLVTAALRAVAGALFAGQDRRAAQAAAAIACALVRHRSSRPRSPVARHLRRTHGADDRHGVGGHRRRHRPAARADRRLRPALARRHPGADLRQPELAADDHVRARHHHRARRRHRHADHRHRRDLVPELCAADPGADAGAEEQRLHPRRAAARRQCRAHHLHPPSAQCRRAADHPSVDGHPGRHHGRGGLELPRPGRAAADAVMGLDPL